MARLEDLRKGASVTGLLPSGAVTVIDVRWHGSDVVELTYRDVAGNLGSELVFRDREPMLEIAAPGTPWAFDGDGDLFTNDRIEAARTGNALQEMLLVIARLDKLSRDEALQEKLEQTDWDLVVPHRHAVGPPRSHRHHSRRDARYRTAK
jgi:hypothetical protein